ncbi:hypothetical protein FQN50_001025 [Emmonsiellopsis sp. PD_5]|nr:hypothetical protein FQN50_001025 [Emmonsiellopsis sp. PD_5]
MALFTRLSNELLYTIFDNLPNSDIKNIRLTSKFLYIVTPLKLDRVFLSSFRKDIDTLRSIAAHPVYSRQIKEIVWDDTRLEVPRLESAEYVQKQAMILDSAQSLLDNLVASAATSMEQQDYLRHDYLVTVYDRLVRWDRGFFLLIRLREEQQSIIDSYEDIETFRFALTAFPHLRRVTIAGHWYRQDGQPHRFLTPLMRSLPSWLRDTWPHCCLEDSSRFKRCPHYGRVEPVPRIYHAAIRELCKSTRLISEFVVDPPGQGVCIYDNFDILSRPNEDFSTFIQRHPLTTLEYTLDLYNPTRTHWSFHRNRNHLNSHWSKILNHGLLKANLSCLDQLEHFTLSSNWRSTNYCHVRDTLRLTNLLPAGCWPNLRSFSLCRFPLRLDELIQFLSALPTPLLSLKLSLVFFPEMAWEQALPILGSSLGWDSNPYTMPKFTVELHAREHGTRIIVLQDELRRFFEGTAANPFAPVPQYWDSRFGTYILSKDTQVLKGFGRVRCEIDKSYDMPWC